MPVTVPWRASSTMLRPLPQPASRMRARAGSRSRGDHAARARLAAPGTTSGGPPRGVSAARSPGPSAGHLFLKTRPPTRESTRNPLKKIWACHKIFSCQQGSRQGSVRRSRTTARRSSRCESRERGACLHQRAGRAPGDHAGVGLGDAAASSTSSGLITHLPYRGVRLTEQGRRSRSRSSATTACIELFLAETLRDALGSRARRGRGARARDLRGARAADRRKLGDPTLDPHGDPIPSAELELRERETRTLDSLHDRGAAACSCASRTPTRRCCATCPNAASPPESDFEVLERQPFGGPLFVRFAAARARDRWPARARHARRARPRGGRRRRRAPAGESARVDLDSEAPAPQHQTQAAVRRECPSAARLAAPLEVILGPSPLEPLLASGRAARNAGDARTGVCRGDRLRRPRQLRHQHRRAARVSATCCCGSCCVANLMAMLIQYLSAKLGIVTDHNLPELFREHYPRAAVLGNVGTGRDDGDGDRRRRVRRRRARA